MLLLRNTMRIPRNGWRFPRNWNHDGARYTHPIDDGKFIYGGDLAELISRVSEYRIINSLPLGEAEIEVNDWLCRTTGAPCAPPKPRDMQAGVKVTGAMVAGFLRAAAEWLTTSDIVPQEEAERRAETCAGCKFNVHVDDGSCLGCFGLLARIMRCIGDRKTRVDAVLKFCGRCGCSLPVVAFSAANILNRAHRNADFKNIETGQVDHAGNPVMCWRGEL